MLAMAQGGTLRARRLRNPMMLIVGTRVLNLRRVQDQRQMTLQLDLGGRMEVLVMEELLLVVTSVGFVNVKLVFRNVVAGV